jgi:hypothetical protein
MAELLKQKLYSDRFTTTPASGQSVNDLIASLTTSGTKTTLVINATQTITNNIPANLTVVVENSGQISHGTTALTISGDFIAGRYQVFTGTGLITFNSQSTEAIFPEWFDTLEKAWNSSKASGVRLDFSNSQYSLTSTLTALDTEKTSLFSSKATNPRDGTYTTGPVIMSTISNSTPSLKVGSPGALLENFHLIGNSANATGIGLTLDRGADTTTLAHIIMRNIYVRGFKSHGVDYRAPDNASLFAYSRSVWNEGVGFNSRPSSTGTIRGLNLGILSSRIGWNKGGNLLQTDINNHFYIGNGFLAPDPNSTTTGTANIKIIGTNATSLYNNFLFNDVENVVSPITSDTNRSLFELGNTRGTILMGNRIGAGYNGILIKGGTVRSLMLFQNHFNSANTRQIVCDGATGWVTFLGDNNDVTPDNPTLLNSGALRHLEFRLDRTNTRTILDSSEPLDIQYRGLSQVQFYYSRTGTTARDLLFNAGDSSSAFKVLRKNTRAGTATAAGTSTQLTSTGANFDQWVIIGQTILNTTDGSSAKVSGIVSGDQINTEALTGGSDNTWSNGDAWSFTDQNLTTINIFGGAAGQGIITAPIGDLELNSSAGNVVINEAGTSTMKFRAETDTLNHALIVDAPNDRIGLGLSALSDFNGSDKVLLRGDSIRLQSVGATLQLILATLPTTEPATVGQVWNDSGTLKIKV